MKKQRSRIFVVEDHPATARGLKAFLELAGYIVTTAGDMRSALQIANDSPFDVLVCDLNLPDGTGWQLMENLRAKTRVRGIAFSAFDEPEHVARSKAAGFDEHVVKGTTPEALLAAIDRITTFSHAADGTAATPARNSVTRDGSTKKRRATRPRKASTTTSRV